MRLQYPEICNVSDYKTVLNTNENFQFIYACKSSKDVVISILHYLILLGYKFNKCNHCGHYFATKTYKEKYCKRKSPYPKYEHLECEKAVRNIKQKLARRKKAVYTHLSNYYRYEILNLFLRRCDYYKGIVDDCPIVEAIKDYDDFLSKERIKQNFYKPEYRS